MANGKRYTDDEIKMFLAEAHEPGVTKSSVATKYGFHPTQFSKWEKKFTAKPKQAKKKVSKNKSPGKPRRNAVQEKIKGLENQVEFWRARYTELLYENNK
jgi:transposase-like protein